MATQQAGLFTQGPSVEDLLQQRNTRATNLQQQLMAQAAQGSRTPAKARAFSLLGSSLGRALSGAVGGGQDQQLAEIRAKEAQRQDFVGRYSKALTGTPQEQLAEGQAMINAGYHEYGGKLVLQGQEGIEAQKAEEARKAALLQQQKRRESLTKRADALGLTSTAQLLKDGGDLAKAADQIRAQEELKVAQKGGRKGRVQIAQQYNKSDEYIKQVSQGDYDHMSDALFLESLKGRDADLKAFQDAEGNVGYHRVDQQGRVFDEASNSWVDASDLGLVQAPNKANNEITVNNLGAIPKDYELVHDPETGALSMKVITGSPTWKKERAAESQFKNKTATEQEHHDTVTGALDDLDNYLTTEGDSFFSPVTGIGGYVASFVPSSLRKDAEKAIAKITSNLGFGELQAMRDNSPTGGALGQVTELEIRLLQSMIGNLELDQSPESLRREIRNIRKRYLRLVDIAKNGRGPRHEQGSEVAFGSTTLNGNQGSNTGTSTTLSAGAQALYDSL